MAEGAGIGRVFKAIANPTRRRVLELLREHPRSAGEIAEHFEMTKPALSHHLSALKNAGLATEQRQGQRVIYSLREDSILEVWDCFLSKLCRPTARRRKARKAAEATVSAEPVAASGKKKKSRKKKPKKKRDPG